MIPPELPSAPDATPLKMPLPKPWEDIFPVAVMSIAPASPVPKVLALSVAPSSREREPVAIVIPPELPSAPDATPLAMPLPKPWEDSPAKEISSVAVMSIAPASPMPKVLAESCAPSSRDREFVAIVRLPLRPIPPAKIPFEITLSTSSIDSSAIISTSPATASSDPKPASMPASRLPLSNCTVAPCTPILPPPSPRTFTLAPPVKLTAA